MTIPLYITESEVESLFTMADAVEVVEQSFIARAKGEAHNEPRRRLPTSSGAYNVMFATWPGHQTAGLKSYAGGRGGINFHVLLYDTAANSLSAVIEANRMGQIRTGAASGVATKFMARADAETVGIIGSGYQAETQLAAVAHVRNVRSAKVYSRSEENRNRYADRMSTALNIEVMPVSSGEEAVEADVVATITSSQQPVLLGEWLQPGTHVNAAGNNSWLKREIDTRAIATCDIVAVDDVEQAKFECGELMRAAEVGRFSWDLAVPIHDIVRGRISGRDDDHQITLFESQGLALEDIAACERIVELARENGVGLPLK
jgi:ornithine cyclodeaminase/alanine dehydrogenase-like protein (mu-crystallin family)